MAGGASSRMKRSLATASLDSETLEIAKAAHKSLIPLGKEGKPLAYYLIRNAARAGYEDVYIITSPENAAFKAEIGYQSRDNRYAGARVHFAIQHLPETRNKPLGTADALQQALDQYPELKNGSFTVCNGDNLYSVKALELLKAPRKAPHALISYSRSGLQFADARIAKFAVMDMDSEGYLVAIVEKPDPATVAQYRDASGEIRVSMNIFSFDGAGIYPFLERCPLHPERMEKELPEAVRILATEKPGSVLCFPRSEHIPDLTAAHDIALFDVLE